MSTPDKPALRTLGAPSKASEPAPKRTKAQQALATKAVETLRAAIRLKGDYATAHYYLGLVHIAQRNKVGAQQEYVILQRLDRDLAQKLFNAAPPNMRN